MKKNKITGTPIKIKNLEVAQHDFPDQLKWKDAKKACAELGEGWRLPTKDELNVLYKNKKKIGGFDGGEYWSSTEAEIYGVWGQYFDDGFQANFEDNIKGTHAVRAVRSV